ncbi:MAG: DUF4350 domain-containing protein [Desulfobacteraceae bacterium]|nr:DUF4350 domain-containing protein [Desulfobacteraceae bacterium]
MSKKTLIIIVTIVAAMLVLAIVFFKTFFVRYEKESRSMPSVQAIKNPFLAAERFLTQIGINAQSLTGRRLLTELPGENDLIIVNMLGGNLPDDKEEILIAWIENGGSLILTADRLWDEKLLKSGNNLFDRYGIRPLLKSEDEKDYKYGDVDTQKFVLEIELEQKRPAKVSFAGNKILVDTRDIADKKYYDKNGIHFIQINIGQGRLIFLSDNEFLKNESIDDNDHAYFLTHLIQNRSEKGIQNRSKVWLLYSSNMPSLLSLIWDKAFYFVVCFSVLLLLCILRLNLRSGPLVLRNSHSSRNLMEHLEASGNYLFKLDKGAGMLKKVQRLTKRSLKERYFFTTQKIQPEQSRLIAKWTDIPAETVHDALFGGVQGEHDFINKSVVLQHLTNSFKGNLKRKNYSHE